MSLDLLLKSIINVSEKAANIARICRSDEHLFSLLIEEKCDDEKNPRFVDDFKTLADVLIQETVKQDIGKLFPEMIDHIYGEESATFCNTLGEKIVVEILENQDLTSARLEQVLMGDQKASNILANQVHSNITSNESNNVPEINENIDFSNLGIYIDPIDATQEYISGDRRCSQYDKIPAGGLECVTILIGVFDRTSGVPLMGVINQPFNFKSNDSYQSKLYWGVSVNDTKLTNIKPIFERSEKIAVLSNSERREFVEILENTGYSVVYSAGAGHKILRLITGDVDLYAISKSTTFKWDTCAPHAILNALGYILLNLKESLIQEQPIEIKYKIDEGKCNKGGVIGLRDLNEYNLFQLKDILCYSKN